jgi:hypothetical protein
MHVLDLLMKGHSQKPHGHKVSFSATNEQDPLSQQIEQQAASTRSSTAEPTATQLQAAAATTASAHSASSTSTCSNDHPQQQPKHQQPQQLMQHQQTHAHPQQQQNGGDPHKLKTELKRLLRRAAVSFRDLNISVHDASTNSLAQLHDTAGSTGTAAPHTHTGASVLTAGRQRVEVEQKKLAIIMVS